MPSPWMHLAPIETERLLLRAFAFSDSHRTMLYAGDPQVARMLSSVPLPFTQRHATAFISDVVASNAAGGGLALAICRRREPEALIGAISFAGENGRAEIGWWLGPPYWGRGFATEAVRAMVSAAFIDESLNLLTAGAFADNAASLRVHAKLGFVETGRRLKPNLARGQPTLHIDMALTRVGFFAVP